MAIESNRNYLMKLCLELDGLNEYFDGNKKIHDEYEVRMSRLRGMNAGQLRTCINDQLSTLKISVKYILFDNESLVKEKSYLEKMLEEEKD